MPTSNRFNALSFPKSMARFNPPPLPIATADIINRTMYGTCDTIALMLRKRLRYTEDGRFRDDYILQAGLHNGPDTIVVATSFHELEATPKTV